MNILCTDPSTFLQKELDSAYASPLITCNKMNFIYDSFIDLLKFFSEVS